jgi:AraC-like DNA-binding protein
MDDVRALLPLLEDIRSLTQHDALWDLSRIEEVSPDAFVALQSYFAGHFRTRLSVERVAVIAPPSGPLRAAAAGLFAFLEPPYSVAAFASVHEALAWLGKGREHAEVAAATAVALASRGFDDLVTSWIAAHLVDASSERCARDVGVTTRTLQRRLAARGSSFELEANIARVRAAESLLSSDKPVTEIAFEIGFSTPQRFANVFRALRGESPTSFRARVRVSSHGNRLSPPRTRAPSAGAKRTG